MSKYEDYNNTSRNYDNQRTAVGADVIAAMMQLYCKKPLKDLHVLDAGCGTGNYTKAIFDHGVGNVTLLDASKGMLEKAKEKLADEIQAGKVKDVVETTMPYLPFPDASFDSIMFNCVLHHIDKSDGSEGFGKATDALREASRILRPGGTAIISTILPATVTHAIWYTQFNSKITEKFNKRMPTVETFEEMFQASSLKCDQRMNILGPELLNDYYYFEGPFDKSWRATFSYWALASPDELKDVQEKVAALMKSGQLEKWVKEHDHVTTSGFLTIFICTKL